MKGMTTRPETDGAEQAYEAMAAVYDDFTAHYDYELFMGNALPELHRNGLRGRRLLDVGCGTGKSFLPMIARGWEATGCDISPSMLAVAQAKAGSRAHLSVADMRELPVFGEFDLVWALDDALNYMLSSEELEQALSGMCANLAPQGLLTFDVNCLQSYRTFFAEEQRVQRGGRTLVWRGLGSGDAEPGAIGEARFEVEGEDALHLDPRIHRQRHFPEAEMLKCLTAAGLECVDVYGMCHDTVPRRPVEELLHPKAVYIARRTQ